MSVIVLTVIVAAIESPAMIDRALVLSCVLVIVRTSPTISVTRTISALPGSGSAFTGQTVALNGVAGNRVAVPVATVREVPDAAGDGATATVVYAKFLCASTGQRTPTQVANAIP
jgi:hypothetical protein